MYAKTGHKRGGGVDSWHAVCRTIVSEVVHLPGMLPGVLIIWSGSVMGMQCKICGKKPVLGNQKTYRGKAKYLGGVGKKITGTSRRVYYPNLQSIRIVLGGKTVRANVCVQCIRSGKVTRPIKRKAFTAPVV
jgi:large subunit ribosomal protein L28